MIRLHEAWPLLAVVCQLGSVGYALLTHRLRKHRRYGWFWRANDWALVVVGSALVAGSAAYALGSWLVFWVLVATYVVWGWSQIALALVDFSEQLQGEREERHAERVARGS